MSLKRFALLTAKTVAASAYLAVPLEGQAAALGPKSQEVRDVIERAASYLDQVDGGLYMGTLGGRCVVGLALLKAGRSREHKNIQAAVNACRAAVAEGAPRLSKHKIYSVGLAAIFLSHFDPLTYRQELDVLVNAIVIRQKESGGWNYRVGDVGDTSVSQYALLGLWEAQQAGSEVPNETIIKAANWLMRTQDPSGCWGYQGEDPGTFERVKQDIISRSMASAGTGALLISAHLLGYLRLKKPVEATGLPAAFRIVDEPEAESEQRPTAAVAGVDPQRLKETIQLANQWTSKNFGIENEGGYQTYYLYTLERHMSFRELAEGGRIADIDWYRQGYEHLKLTQSPQGTWETGCGAAVDSAFGLLFLLRSTQDSIRRRLGLGDGLLAGGRGLPASLAGARLEDGQVVGAELKAATDALLEILSDPDHPDFSQLASASTPIQLSDDPQTQSRQLARLRRLVRGVDPNARLIAARSLARSGNLDTVPNLIYALSDPDPRVVRAARNGLRRLSRRVHGVGMPAAPTPQQVTNAISDWKNWYRMVNPDARFED